MVGQEKVNTGIAFSGGGFRATLFHVGSLWRLNELGWLPKLSRITSVSGGSITAGVLAHRWKKLHFPDGCSIADNFREQVADPLQAFCSHLVDVPAIIKGLLWPFASAGDFVADSYDRHLFHGATLQDLPADGEGPRFIFYGTSYQTGVSVRLTRRYLSDYKLGRLPNPDLPLSKAVAISSAFPPLLAPIMVKTDPRKWQDPIGTSLQNQDTYRRKMYLTDGGVYDNMGIEAIWKDCETILVSDAGAPLATEPNPWLLKWSYVAGALRVLGITTEQTRALRKRMLIEKYKTDDDTHRDGSYWGIATHIDNYKLGDPHFKVMVNDNSITESLKFMRTRLNSFSPAEQGRLINWEYALTDAAMRRHVIAEDTPLGTWPIESFPLT
ncbi:MAG: patatin-like phospholipase family protein [Gammaproteobacteria bacterium]|nr:MAG: patatin-like phospholipase family protein [Gammaproteobacteria bacterium]